MQLIKIILHERKGIVKFLSLNLNPLLVDVFIYVVNYFIELQDCRWR